MFSRRFVNIVFNGSQFTINTGGMVWFSEVKEAIKKKFSRIAGNIIFLDQQGVVIDRQSLFYIDTAYFESGGPSLIMFVPRTTRILPASFTHPPSSDLVEYSSDLEADDDDASTLAESDSGWPA